jgi:hypothetical protein
MPILLQLVHVGLDLLFGLPYLLLEYTQCVVLATLGFAGGCLRTQRQEQLLDPLLFVGSGLPCGSFLWGVLSWFELLHLKGIEAGIHGAHVVDGKVRERLAWFHLAFRAGLARLAAFALRKGLHLREELVLGCHVEGREEVLCRDVLII